MRKRFSLLLASWLIVGTLALNISGCVHSRIEADNTTTENDLWVREELIFGGDIPAGGTVSDEEWQQFLGEVVTPRFPKGFSILNGHGQYLMQDGTIVREKSWVLFIYIPGLSSEAEKAIDEIITSYKLRFNQESVLRSTSPARVQFK